MPPFARILSLLLILPVAAGVSACDNSISPLADDAERIFAIHGYLDSEADTHYVRVSALRETVLAEDPPLEGVVVQSREAASEDVVGWSLVPEDPGGGVPGRLFAGAFDPRSGAEYVLEVLRDGEVLASATTVVPDDPILVPGPPGGDSLQYRQAVVIDGINEKPLTLKMRYEVFAPDADSAETVLLDYDQAGELAGTGWQFHVFLRQDQVSLRRRLGVPDEGPALGLRRIGAVFTIPSAEFDNPDEPTNLENAHGFFGSIGRHELSWTLTPEAVAFIGYVDKQIPP